MTELEKMEANEAKQQRIYANNNCCEVCKKRFGEVDLQLAHKISAGKINVERFSRLIMYHPDMMVLTCASCNSSVLINVAGQPVKAFELIIDIMSKLLLSDQAEAHFSRLREAFNNVEYKYIINPVSKGKYDILYNYFYPDEAV